MSLYEENIEMQEKKQSKTHVIIMSNSHSLVYVLAVLVPVYH